MAAIVIGTYTPKWAQFYAFLKAHKGVYILSHLVLELMDPEKKKTKSSYKKGIVLKNCSKISYLPPNKQHTIPAYVKISETDRVRLAEKIERVTPCSNEFAIKHGFPMEFNDPKSLLFWSVMCSAKNTSMYLNTRGVKNLRCCFHMVKGAEPMCPAYANLLYENNVLYAAVGIFEHLPKCRDLAAVRSKTLQSRNRLVNTLDDQHMFHCL